jgi:hypothetical protein
LKFFINFFLNNHRNRIPTDQWWLKLRSLLRIMAHHESVYVSEIIKCSCDDFIEDFETNLDEIHALVQGTKQYESEVENGGFDSSKKEEKQVHFEK